MSSERNAKRRAQAPRRAPIAPKAEGEHTKRGGARRSARNGQSDTPRVWSMVDLARAADCSVSSAFMWATGSGPVGPRVRARLEQVRADAMAAERQSKKGAR